MMRAMDVLCIAFMFLILQSSGLPDDDNFKKKLHSLAKQAIER